MKKGPKLDQHFLVDERVADRIVEYAELKGDERVLEIGPGRGVLTGRLAGMSGGLHAVELDEDLASELEERFPSVKVVRGNALQVDLPEFDVCVSNLPYSVSSEVTFRLLERGFDRAILMYQREFADRLLAEAGSGDYGRLTVAVDLKCSVSRLEDVPRTAFQPRPRVNSTVVRLEPRESPYTVSDEGSFLDIVRAVFTQRRKKTRNALLNTRHMTGLDEGDIRSLDTELLERRPGNLEPRELAKLADLLK